MKLFSSKTKASILRDFVYSANDGAITTFAIIAGSQGASLGNNVVLILGVANLLADGLSMASGNYLGVKTEIEYKKNRGDETNDEESPIIHGTITFGGFLVSGAVPLLPFVFNFPGAFGISTVFVALVLFGVGFARGKAIKADAYKSGFEMLAIGGSAAAVAYFVGYLLDRYVV